MTKSFPLSVLVPALSAITAVIPLAVWHDFNITGRQGVSALPVLFTAFVIAALATRSFKPTNHVAGLMATGSWHGFLWFATLTQPPQGRIWPALARALSELLYTTSPILLVGLAGGVAILVLMMLTPPQQGNQA